LDLSAAFDCVDHDPLLQRLQLSFGLTGVVLSQQIAYDGQLSAIRPLLFGVLQGSVLGPLLYVLYTAELGHRVATHGMYLRQYADDSQVYTVFGKRDQNDFCDIFYKMRTILMKFGT